MTTTQFNGMTFYGMAPEYFDSVRTCSCGREFKASEFGKTDADYKTLMAVRKCEEQHDSVAHQDWLIAQGVMRANRIHWPNPTLERCEATSAALHADGRLR
jgi:hypothetical protein